MQHGIYRLFFNSNITLVYASGIIFDEFEEKALEIMRAICVWGLIGTAFLPTDIKENKLIERKDGLKSRSEQVANLANANLVSTTTMSNTAHSIDFCSRINDYNLM